MSASQIRLADPSELQELRALRRASILSLPPGDYSKQEIEHWSELWLEESWLKRLLDQCTLVAEDNEGLLATNALDLDNREMMGLFVHPRAQNQGWARKMTIRCEQLAIQYGLTSLYLEAATPAIPVYKKLGYRAKPGAEIEAHPKTGLGSLAMDRSIARRQTQYSRYIKNLLSRLNIPQDYALKHRFPLQTEANRLDSIGEDIYQREQRLIPRAAKAWRKMQAAAGKEGVELQVVSAFRSVVYQQGLIEKKLARGESPEDILQVSAAPGFSEHHSGRALDITTLGYPVLEQGFEKSPAFQWLQSSAAGFGFHLSFPENNRHGLCYEPWHWCYRD